MLQVKWGNKVSEPFKISSGVRKGNILSPILIKLYLDRFSLTLKACHTACVAGNLMYAYDIVLLLSNNN